MSFNPPKKGKCTEGKKKGSPNAQVDGRENGLTEYKGGGGGKVVRRQRKTCPRGEWNGHKGGEKKGSPRCVSLRPGEGKGTVLVVADGEPGGRGPGAG